MWNKQGPLSVRRRMFEAEVVDTRQLPYNLIGIDDLMVHIVAKDSTVMVRRNQIRVVGNVIAIEGLRISRSFAILRSENADCVWTENLRSRSVETDLVIADVNLINIL
jgi:hypothetical protein